MTKEGERREKIERESESESEDEKCKQNINIRTVYRKQAIKMLLDGFKYWLCYSQGGKE